MQDAPFLAHSKCFNYIYDSTPLLQSYSSIAGHKETDATCIVLCFTAKQRYTTKCISTLCCLMWCQTKIYSTY
jgi:hypothetical protein